jgi:thymidylate synthase (FAD)
MVARGYANDKTKYCMPECFRTNLVSTWNVRSLQNFLTLRTSSAALEEIRDLAHAIYNALPMSHRFMFQHIMEE